MQVQNDKIENTRKRRTLLMVCAILALHADLASSATLHLLLRDLGAGATGRSTLLSKERKIQSADKIHEQAKICHQVPTLALVSFLSSCLFFLSSLLLARA